MEWIEKNKGNSTLTATIIIAAIVVLFGIGFLYPVITGRIIAQGGNVTQLNFEPPPVRTYWQGVYGNVSNRYTGNELAVDSSGTGIEMHNLGLMKCLITEVYATTLPSIDWANVVPADPADVDNYLGVAPTDPKSGSSIFTSEKFYNIYGANRYLHYTITNSVSGEYDLGLLKQGGTLIFVTQVENGTLGFAGGKTNYQMMLPARPGANPTYHFFLDPADAVSCGQLNDYPQIRYISMIYLFSEGASVDFFIGNEKHNLKIRSMGDNYANFVLSSNPVLFTLHPGEEMEFDLGLDGIKDTKVRLVGISDGIATVVLSIADSPIYMSMYIMEENRESTIMIEGEDANDDPITITSNFGFNINYLDNTTVIIYWTPENNDAGYNDITFAVTDYYGHMTNKMMTAFVTPVNDPPELTLTSDFEAYFHVPFTTYLYARDIDNENTYTGDDNELEFDTRQHIRFIDLESRFNVTGNNYYGMINFTPLESQKGRWNLSIYVTDGTAYDEENVTLNVGYCGNLDEAGEPRCESDYESCENCREDCGECSADNNKFMTIEVGNRNCLYGNISVKLTGLVERGSCDTRGEVLDNREKCGFVDSVTVERFIMNGSSWEPLDRTETDLSGKATFSADVTGNYKLVATKRGYNTAYRYFGVSECKSITKTEIPADTKEPPAEEDKKTGRVIEEETPGETEIGRPSTKSLLVGYGALLIISIIVINAAYKLYTANKETSKLPIKLDEYSQKLKRHFSEKIMPKISRVWEYILEFLGFREIK